MWTFHQNPSSAVLKLSDVMRELFTLVVFLTFMPLKSMPYINEILTTSEAIYQNYTAFVVQAKLNIREY